MSVIDLDGKRIIVTGASSGIGRAAAMQMATSGARVLLVARRERELKEAVDEIRAKGGAADLCVADVSSLSETREYIEKARALWAGIDGVFANAGAGGVFAPLTDYPPEEMDKMLSVNLRSAFYAIQLALPEMIARRSGSIAVTGSLASLLGFPMTVGYNIAKHAVLGLVRSAAAEVARYNVRVNCIIPGLIHTPMLDGIATNIGGGDAAAGAVAIGAMAPQGRMGRPEEVGAVAAFLMSDASSYVNGQFWSIDGGILGAFRNGA